MLKKANLILLALIAIDVVFIACCHGGNSDILFSSNINARVVNINDTADVNTGIGLSTIDTCDAAQFSCNIWCADSVAATHKMALRNTSIIVQHAYACKPVMMAETKDRITDISLKPTQQFNASIAANVELCNDAKFVIHSLGYKANTTLNSKAEAIAFINNYFNEQKGYKAKLGQAIPGILVVPNTKPSQGSTNSFVAVLTLQSSRVLTNTSASVQFK
jgi:hypothetical protein